MNRVHEVHATDLRAGDLLAVNDERSPTPWVRSRWKNCDLTPPFTDRGVRVIYARETMDPFIFAVGLEHVGSCYYSPLAIFAVIQ